MAAKSEFLEIAERAKEVADIYGLSYGYVTPRDWEQWSVAAREDFWSIAQEDVPVEFKILLPDEYARAQVD